MSTGAIDEARLEQFMGRMVGYMTGATACFSIWLGDELGLYRALARESARSADELAEEAGCHPRLVREWLDGQAAAGLVEYDPEADRYSLSAEAAMALADDTSPVFVARAMNAFGSMFMDWRSSKRRSPATARSPGVIITRACSKAPSGSSAPAIARICRASGSRR